MYGLGLLKGLGVTLKHFIDAYTEEVRWLGKRYTTQTFAVRQGKDSKGVFTVEYPDEKIAVPERFRFVPFLVINNLDDPFAPGDDWCTSCGICAKVCPPQCIWIVRGTDPVTGRPKPQPEAFYIDIDICMNCGYCAEYCPFDAIKMDHDYELATYDRTTHNIYDKKKLSKEFRYWQTIAPTRVWDEAEARGHWEHKDVEKLAKKAGVTLPPPTEENIWRATTVLPTEPQAVAPGAPAIAAPAPAPTAAAPVAAPTGLTGNPFVDMANEALPLPFRAKAAVEGRQMIDAKTYKPTSNDRKAISAVQKLAKDRGTTIEELAAQATGTPVMAAPPPPPPVASSPTPPPPAAAVAAAPAADNEIWLAKELETKGKNKEIKLTGDDRKRISRAKAAAAEAGLDWENLPVAGSVAVPVAAAAPVETPSAPAPQAAPPPPAPAAPAGGANAELSAAKELERKGQAKEIKLTGEDRKRIARAKAAAKEAGIDWDTL